MRECVRADESQGVVWLKNGGWLRLENAYLTRERAEEHKHDTLSDLYGPRSEDERG